MLHIKQTVQPHYIVLVTVARTALNGRGILENVIPCVSSPFIYQPHITHIYEAMGPTSLSLSCLATPLIYSSGSSVNECIELSTLYFNAYHVQYRTGLSISKQTSHYPSVTITSPNEHYPIPGSSFFTYWTKRCFQTQLRWFQGCQDSLCLIHTLPTEIHQHCNKSPDTVSLTNELIVNVRGDMNENMRMTTYIRHKVSGKPLLLVKHNAVFIVVCEKSIVDVVNILVVEETLDAIWIVQVFSQ